MRPWIAIKALGIPFSEEVISLNAPDFKAHVSKVSGTGKVPVLSEGDIHVWESLAILDYLAGVGDIRSCRDLEAHFSRNFGIEGVTTACEYLATRGLIGKASTATRLTRKSHVDVQELAFFSIGDARTPP